MEYKALDPNEPRVCGQAALDLELQFYIHRALPSRCKLSCDRCLHAVESNAATQERVARCKGGMPLAEFLSTRGLCNHTKAPPRQGERPLVLRERWPEGAKTQVEHAP